MKTVVMVAIGMLSALAGVVTTASAQDASAPDRQKPPAQPNILLELAPPKPTAPGPADSITRDDLRDLPAPPPDRLSNNPRVRVYVGDPRCLPGEDFVFTPPRPGRRR